MPLSPFLTIYTKDGQPLPGATTITSPDGVELEGSYVQEFEHGVYTIKKGYYYALLYGVDFVRQHEPMIIIKEIDKMTVPLLKNITSGAFLPKIELRWYEYNKNVGKTEEYFRMTLEHLRLQTIKHSIPDVKDQELEQYGHLERIEVVYQKITWLYVNGYLTYTDIWNEAFSELDRKDFEGKEENPVEDLSEMVFTEKLEIKFTSGKFEETKDGFGFDKKGKVTFTFSANRKPDHRENKIYAKLYALLGGKVEDLCQTNEGRLVNDGNWSTEFKLIKPKSYENELKNEPETEVKYYVVIENAYAVNSNFESEKITIPKMDYETLFIQLDIDPNEEVSADDKFTLLSSDNAATYRQEKTVKDDQVYDNQFVDLRFTGIDPELAYSLEINPGKEGEPYLLFENQTFAMLRELSEG